MAQYYVVRDKNTGLYFRGKGVNRWGKYYNQASIYRIKANAENTIKEVSWRGEQAEVVPIQIIENNADVVPKSEVERLEKEIKALLAFKDYFSDLYGHGLEVANWHENGALEPFDNFYDSAEEEYERSLI